MKTQTISAKSINNPIASFLFNVEQRFARKDIKSSLKQLDFKSLKENTKKMFTKKKLPKLIIPLAVIVVLVVVINSFFQSTSSNTQTITGSQSDERFEVKAPLATMDINKDYQFPVVDEKGKEIGKFTYSVLSTELKDEINAKGKRATAVKGRLFLIVNVKVSNPLDKGLQVNSRDYVRLTVNGNDAEKIAPDVHNDPIDAQAISTKVTRVGFAVNDTDTNFVLQIGEIKGDKESINLTFNQ